MKVDPKTGMRYAHTPEEWAEVLRKHGAGMSLPASVAARVQDQVKKSAIAHGTIGTQQLAKVIPTSEDREGRRGGASGQQLLPPPAQRLQVVSRDPDLRVQ